MPRAVEVSRPAGGTGEDGGPPDPGGARGGARRAATLALLYRGADGQLSIPLTVRQSHLRAHGGEVSLPGGAVDPSDRSPQDAALREAREEIGLSPETVHVVGSLDEVWIPVSNFRIRPFVALSEAPPSLVAHTPEVAAIVELPVAALVRDDAIVERLIEGPDWRLRAGAYLHADQVIWGATARALAMLATVVRRAAAPLG